MIHFSRFYKNKIIKVEVQAKTYDHIEDSWSSWGRVKKTIIPIFIQFPSYIHFIKGNQKQPMEDHILMSVCSCNKAGSHAIGPYSSGHLDTFPSQIPGDRWLGWRRPGPRQILQDICTQCDYEGERNGEAYLKFHSYQTHNSPPPSLGISEFWNIWELTLEWKLQFCPII